MMYALVNVTIFTLTVFVNLKKWLIAEMTADWANW